MKYEDILEAKEEAERFLKSVDDYLKKNEECNNFSEWPSPARATVRRKSMDLTRSLSKMRNPK